MIPNHERYQVTLIGDNGTQARICTLTDCFGDNHAAVTPPGYWSARWESNPQATVSKTARFAGFLHLPLLEVPVRFELTLRELQSLALPLGYRTMLAGTQ